jgi:hypothetical protein
MAAGILQSALNIRRLVDASSPLGVTENSLPSLTMLMLTPFECVVHGAELLSATADPCAGP